MFPRPLRSLATLTLLAGLAACSQSPASPTMLPGLNTAHAALQSGSPQMALSICANLARAEPRSAEALVCQADALVALGKPTEADGAYTAALLLDPNAAGALLGLGRMRLMSEPAKAEDLFVRLLRTNPRNAAALNDLGIARDLQDRHAEAQSAYADALAADPNMRAAQVNMALSMALDGRSGEAERRLLPIAEGPEASARERHDLAAVLAMNGQNDAARRLLEPELQGAALDDALAGYRALAR